MPRPAARDELHAARGDPAKSSATRNIPPGSSPAQDYWQERCCSWWERFRIRPPERARGWRLHKWQLTLMPSQHLHPFCFCIPGPGPSAKGSARGGGCGAVPRFPRVSFLCFCILPIPPEQSMTELVRGAVLPRCGMPILPLPFPEGAGSHFHQAAAKPPGIHL